MLGDLVPPRICILRQMLGARLAPIDRPRNANSLSLANGRTKSAKFIVGEKSFAANCPIALDPFGRVHSI